MLRHRITATAATALAAAMLAVPAVATTAFSVSYESEAPGMQNTTVNFAWKGVETFNSRAIGSNQNFTTDYGSGGSFTGSYTGVQIKSADQYGGAGGNSRYAVTFSSAGYALDLATNGVAGVNYFGYWLSALDNGNVVKFYRSGREVFRFAPSDVRAALAPLPNRTAYYGNPNAPLGRNKGEPYVFLNFFANHGTFDRVVFTQVTGGGYESDNHTVGRFTTRGTGTNVNLVNSVVATVPDLKTWACLFIGFVMVGGNQRRRNQINRIVAA